MNTFVVVVFPDEKLAFEGLSALEKLHSQGSIALYSHAVVYRDQNGLMTVKEKADEGPLGLAVGAIVGGLVGMLGGPAGAAIGLAGGSLIGGVRDLFNFGLSEEFLESVERRLAKGEYGVIAEVSEEWISPLDMRMEELGGTVIREVRDDVLEESIKARVAARKEELAKLRRAHAGAKADKMRLALSAELERSTAKLERSAEKARVQLLRTQQEAEAKVKALEKQAAKADPDARRQIEERIAEMRAEYDYRSGKLKSAWELAQEGLRT